MVPGWQCTQRAHGLSMPSALRSVVLGALGLLATAGCLANKPVQREVVVQWMTDSTNDQHDAIRTECGSLPGVVAEARSPAQSAAGRLDDVRFDVTQASERQVNALYECLRGKPGVAGAAEPEQQ